MVLSEKTIANIVTEDFVFARVLDFFGINFYEYSSETLSALCTQKGISERKLVDQFDCYQADLLTEQLNLDKYPVDLIVEYLKHAHHVFVKDRLSYIARLIQNYNVNSLHGDRFIKDLQFIFPLFLQEFIEHIYEEEDDFFSYLDALTDAVEGKGNFSKLYYLMKNNSVVLFSMEHGHEEDEMKGIRTITNNYSLDQVDDVHLMVILKELKKFDKDLKQHALIEDDILIPKAIRLEQKVKLLIQEKSRWN